MLAPGPETGDEDWQLSKDSADAATGVPHMRSGRQKEIKEQN